MAGEELLSECRGGWLTVASDFSAKLSKPEQLKHALQCVGRNPSTRSVERYWSQYGGAMSFQQFSLVMKRERKTARADLMAAFKKIDLNGDGYITAEELLRLLTKRGDRMSREEAQGIIDEADTNGDGKLDYAEFCHMIASVSDDCLKATQIRAERTLQQSAGDKSSRSRSRTASGQSQKVVERRERRRAEFREQLFPSNDLAQKTSPPSSAPNSPPHSGNNIPPAHLAPTLSGKTDTGDKMASNLKRKSKKSSKKAKKVSVLADPFDAPSSSFTHLPPLAATSLTSAALPPLKLAPSSLSEHPPKGKADLEGTVKADTSEIARTVGTTNDVPSPQEKEEGSVLEAEVPEEEISSVSSEAASSRRDDQGGEGPNAAALLVEGQLESGPAQPVDEKQTGHLSTSPLPPPSSSATKFPPSSMVPPAPRKPANIQTWNSITGKGCFYLEPPAEGQEVGVVRCHHYRLVLPTATNVWVEMGVAPPGNLATDVLLFVFRTDSNDEPSDFIAYTQHWLNEHWVCRLDLDPGTYALVPFTTGCHLKACEGGEGGEGVRVVSGEQGGAGVNLTAECRVALEEVFHRSDLDSNGYLSRTEFDFFQEKTTGEICDDETWKVIQDNFEMTAEDELTLAGFIKLHVMTARDEEGGGAEVWQVLSSLGYCRGDEFSQKSAKGRLKLLISCRLIPWLILFSLGWLWKGVCLVKFQTGGARFSHTLTPLHTLPLWCLRTREPRRHWSRWTAVEALTLCVVGRAQLKWWRHTHTLAQLPFTCKQLTGVVNTTLCVLPLAFSADIYNYIKKTAKSL